MTCRPAPLLALLPLLAAVSAAASSTQSRRVAVRVVPSQSIAAISIRSGAEARSVVVTNGFAIIPADVPLPWSVQMLRFESDPYTADDLAAGRPWTIRELGIVRGIVQPRRSGGEGYTWLLANARSQAVTEVGIKPDDRGSFDFRLPAGLYHGVLSGASSGTRIRSGIVVKAGETTDLGPVVVEPAVAVSVRVVDQNGRGGISGARVIWDPPNEMLNATLSRNLYSRRWSAVTDRNGVALVRGVGPAPHSARWRVEASGFAATRTASVLLGEASRFAVPDVRLRPEPSVTVRVSFPREESKELAGARLVAAENRDSRTRVFDPIRRVPLAEGSTVFRFSSYGLKRVWVESAAGKKLSFRTFEVTEPISTIDFVLRQVEISGRVTYRDEPLEGVMVSLADPMNGRELVAQVPSDEDGRFAFRTWAVGPMTLYTIASRTRSGQGKRFGSASAKLELDERTQVSVDLEIPKAGFSLTVTNRETGAPVRASLMLRTKERSDGGSGRGTLGQAETDAEGRFDLTGYPEGTARLVVSAKGYRAETVDIAIAADRPDAAVRLQRAKPSTIRVIDSRGAPIRGASVLGGFDNEHDVQPLYEKSTDADGRVELDSPPPPGTLFYVAADGYALGLAMTAPEGEVMVPLSPPTSSIVTLRQNNQAPERVFLVVAAPAGREIIPLTVLEELAIANGLTLYQLCGTSAAGDVVLPQFLGPGTYDLFLARRGGTPFRYERMGSVRTPLTRNSILAIQ